MSGPVQNFSQRLKGALRNFVGGDPFADRPDPVEWNGLRATCHTAWPADPTLIAAWDALLDNSRSGRTEGARSAATTFHSPTWQHAVVETQAKPGRLRLMTVHQADRLVAVLPMSLRDDGLLETLAPGVSDYLDPLIAADVEPEVWRILLKLFTHMRAGKWKNVTLHNIRDAATCRTLLPALAKAEGFDLEERIIENCPCLTLPKAWDDYLATLDSHERKETRRKVNKVMTKGAGRNVRCGADPAEIATTLATALSLMELAPGEKGDAVKTTLRPLLEKAAPALIASGQLWLTTLYVNDEPAACTIQFAHPAGPQLYNCGFDSAKREWSAGVVLTAHIIQQAIESGAQAFDLLRGQEPYKYKLGAIDRPLWMISLRKN